MNGQHLISKSLNFVSTAVLRRLRFHNWNMYSYITACDKMKVGLQHSPFLHKGFTDMVGIRPYKLNHWFLVLLLAEACGWVFWPIAMAHKP